MLVGLGVDVARIGRFKDIFSRHGVRFARKFLHPNELSRYVSICVQVHLPSLTFFLIFFLRFVTKFERQNDVGIQFLASRLVVG